MATFTTENANTKIFNLTNGVWNVVNFEYMIKRYHNQVFNEMPNEVENALIIILYKIQISSTQQMTFVWFFQFSKHYL